jgi:hypothetical protein
MPDGDIARQPLQPLLGEDLGDVPHLLFGVDLPLDAPLASPMFVSDRRRSDDTEAIPALSCPRCCRAYNPR